MTERFHDVENRHSRFSTGLELVKRYEREIATGITVGSILYIKALNKVLGIDDDINPATLTEIISVGLAASICGASYKMRQKPSEMLSDMISLVKLSLKKNNSQS